MFVLRTLSCEVLKCKRLSVFSKIVPLQIRAGSYKKSKPVGDPSDYTEYDIIHNPEEWKYVERLLPVKWIPDPKPKESYPSGWQPQTADPEKVPYYIERTKNHMLPVYLLIDKRGTQRITKIVKVEGDIWRLSREIVAYIKPLMGYTSIGAKVNEFEKKILLRGDFVEYTKRFLIDKGF